jgi:oligoribonuclease
VSEALVWIDCEMTGLNAATDVLVEVAVVLTDSELNILDEGLDLLIKTDPDKLASMEEVVLEMHRTSGLLEALAGATLAVEEAETRLLDHIKRWVPDRRKSPLCGNSIATDRTFIARYMPRLDDHLHYRMIDVSSIKELSRRWYPKAYFNAPVKTGGHRALADIIDSINELRYYRAAVFVPAPGPDTDTAKAAAQAAVLPPPGSVAPE